MQWTSQERLIYSIFGSAIEYLQTKKIFGGFLFLPFMLILDYLMLSPIKKRHGKLRWKDLGDHERFWIVITICNLAICIGAQISMIF